MAFELRSRALAFRDVAQHAQDRGLVLVRRAVGHELELGDAAVLAQEAHLVRAHQFRARARAHARAKTLVPQRQQLGRDHAFERQAGELVAFVAETLEQQAIGVDEAEILRDEDAVRERIHQGLDHRAVALLAAAQRSHGGALARDVVEDAEHGRPAVPVGAGRGDGQVPRAAVGQRDAVLAVVLLDAARDELLERLGRTVALVLGQQRGEIAADERRRLAPEHPGRAGVDVEDAVAAQDRDPGSNVVDHMAVRAAGGRGAIVFTHLLGTPCAARSRRRLIGRALSRTTCGPVHTDGPGVSSRITLFSSALRNSTFHRASTIRGAA